MNLLTERLTNNKRRGVSSLVLFLTGGYPTLDSTVDLVLRLEDGGADAVEIGMPFSDPVADGSMIQRSSAIALANGATIPWMLEQVSALHERTSIPLILMGYVNPILRYGVDRFFVDAAAAGVDGVILPEVPLGEWERFRTIVEAQHLCGILLVAPTTSPARVRAIDDASSGFLYAVSSTGVTGGAPDGNAMEYIKETQKHVRKNPMLVGFGISSPDHARNFARLADGVVVGSAFLRALEGGRRASAVAEWVQTYRVAIDESVAK
jgi:tryptophan synthase alpha chain